MECFLPNRDAEHNARQDVTLPILLFLVIPNVIYISAPCDISTFVQLFYFFVHTSIATLCALAFHGRTANRHGAMKDPSFQAVPSIYYNYLKKYLSPIHVDISLKYPVILDCSTCCKHRSFFQLEYLPTIISHTFLFFQPTVAQMNKH